jgi:hypothetical protein
MKAALLPENSNEVTEDLAPESREHPLPLGRRVVVHVGGSDAAIEVRSPEGEIEVRIEVTQAGPVVRLRGARLEIESPDAVAVRCQRLEIAASERAEIRSEGDVKVAAGGAMDLDAKRDMKLVGDRIFLN